MKRTIAATLALLVAACASDDERPPAGMSPADAGGAATIQGAIDPTRPAPVDRPPPAVPSMPVTSSPLPAAAPSPQRGQPAAAPSLPATLDSGSRSGPVARDLGPLRETAGANQELAAARSIRCTVGPGMAGEWKAGRPSIDRHLWGRDPSLRFEEIDHAAASARMVTGQFSSEVLMLLTPGGLHFIEETSSGSVFVSTIFPTRAGEGYAFVTSRHLLLPDGPTPGQYFGSCRVTL